MFSITNNLLHLCHAYDQNSSYFFEKCSLLHHKKENYQLQMNTALSVELSVLWHYVCQHQLLWQAYQELFMHMCVFKVNKIQFFLLSERQFIFQYDKQYTILAKRGHIAMAQQCRQNKYHTPTQGLSCHQEIISHSSVTGYLQISHMNICILVTQGKQL